jgi:hypothetical protein
MRHSNLFYTILEICGWIPFTCVTIGAIAHLVFKTKSFHKACLACLVGAGVGVILSVIMLIIL